MTSDFAFNRFLKGDSWALAKSLVDESVDCVVTSPPYWGLRDYGVPGQAGLEEHPQLWVDKMVELCELIRPKLKKSGVMFWNIGETYFSKIQHSDWSVREDYPDEQKTGGFHSEREEDKFIRKLNINTSAWLQPKQLLGLPWRFAIAMQDKGWILRNAIIWDKPNHMPSSVKDRFSNGYEYVFMFVKSKKYWFDLDAVREPHKYPEDTLRRMREDDEDGITPFQKGQEGANWRKGLLHIEQGVDKKEVRIKNLQEKGQLLHSMHKLKADGVRREQIIHPMGKNCGDVWRITTKPHPFAHFAVFPEALAERCVKSGCPEWVCKKCGKPRERISESTGSTMNQRVRDVKEGRIKSHQVKASKDEVENYGKETISVRRTVGWSDCGCNAGWQGGVVLDCFMGSGTVAVVAKRLNRQYLGFELNQKYINIANNRLAGIIDWQTIKDIENGKQKVLREVFQ